MYHALNESGLADRHIIQDLPIPFATAQRAIEYVDAESSIWPLWLYPLRYPRKEHKSLHVSAVTGAAAADGALDISVWDPGPRRYHEFVEANCKLEQMIQAVGGLEMLHARTYYKEDELLGFTIVLGMIMRGEVQCYEFAEDFRQRKGPTNPFGYSRVMIVC